MVFGFELTIKKVFEMARIKKGDIVMVLAGKDRGKTGKVLNVLPKEERAIVEGVNFIKKHVRRRREEQQGGIVQMENPIYSSNLAIFCKGCNRAARVGFTKLRDGTKSRFCKKCKEII